MEVLKINRRTRRRNKKISHITEVVFYHTNACCKPEYRIRGMTNRTLLSSKREPEALANDMIEE